MVLFPYVTTTFSTAAAKKLWRRYTGPFVRNVAVVAGGAALAQLVSVVVAPVVTRIYAPVEYGALAVFTSIVLVASSAASLAYHFAIPLPSRDQMAFRLLVIAIGASLGTSAAVGVLLVLIGGVLPELFNLQSIAHLLFLIPVSVFFASLAQSLEQWLVRKKSYAATSGAAVTQAVVAGTGRIGAGLTSPTAGVLISVGVGAQFVQLLLLLRAAHRTGAHFRRGSRAWAGWRALCAAARRYDDFPRYRAPQQLLNVSSRSAPLLLLAAVFSPAVGALYSVALTVLYLPVTLISISAGKVFVQRLAEQARGKGLVTPSVTKATLALAAMGFVPFGAIALAGPQLFGIIFGAEWQGAGVHARWLSMMVFAHFINVPAVSSMTVLRAQRKLLVWEVVTSVVKIILVFAAAKITGNPVVTIAAYSIFGTLAYLSLISTGIKHARSHDEIAGR